MKARIDKRAVAGVIVIVAVAIAAWLIQRPDQKSPRFDEEVRAAEARTDELRGLPERSLSGASERPVTGIALPPADEGSVALEKALSSADPVAFTVTALRGTDQPARDGMITSSLSVILHLPEERRASGAAEVAAALAGILSGDNAEARRSAMHQLSSMYDMGLIDGQFFAQAARSADKELRERALAALLSSSNPGADQILFPLIAASDMEEKSQIFAGVDKARYLRGASRTRLEALMAIARTEGRIPQSLTAAVAP